MDPVLIFTDTNLIAQEKATLNSSVPLYQNVYNAFKAIGITVTIAEIFNLVGWTYTGNGAPAYVENFAKDKLVAIAGGYTYNGVALKNDKLRELIADPNVTAVYTALNASKQIYSGAGGRQSIRPTMLHLTGDVVSKVAGTDATIEAFYTYYTKSDEAAALATSLQTICDAMNTHSELYPDYNRPYLTSGHQVNFTPGIDIRSGIFCVSLSYINRFQERLDS